MNIILTISLDDYNNNNDNYHGGYGNNNPRSYQQKKNYEARSEVIYVKKN